MLIIKGFIIGIGKIIPGVSGAVLAINLGVYERLIDSIIHFFDKPKENLKFLLFLGIGILLALILGSKLILYLFNNYKFITMMFFVGLLLGGTYRFAKKIRYSVSRVIIMLIIISILLLLSMGRPIYNYLLDGSNRDYLILFLGGALEMVASIIPGISATSLFMLLGIYDIILNLIANIYNFNYVFNHFWLYFCYGLGMFVAFLMTINFINFAIKKHQNTSYLIILALMLYSIIMLIIMTFKIKIILLELAIGIILLIIGIMLGKIV